jgi:hypothetical protein
MSYLLTPPTTPDDERSTPRFPCDFELIVFDICGPDNCYGGIELRGKMTKENIRIKVDDLISHFKLNIAYMRTVAQYLVVYSVQELYRQDLYSILGVSNNDPTFCLEYAQSHELYIKYKGLDILAHNVPKLAPFRDWLESMMDVDLHCHEEINYDTIGW